MKKQLIAAAVSVGLAVTANAGSLQDSSAQSAASKDGSLESLAGVLGSAKATLSIVSDGIVTAANSAESASDAASTSASRAAELLGDSVMYIFTTPISGDDGMVGDSLDASRASGEFIVDTSGNIYRSVEGSVTYVLTTPSRDQSKASAEASKTAVEVVVDAAGNIVTVSGDYVSDKYGEPAKAVRNGSGQVFVASGASVVISANTAKDASVATLTFIDETSIEAASVSAESAGDILEVLSVTPAKIFNASKRGKLNDK